MCNRMEDLVLWPPCSINMWHRSGTIIIFHDTSNVKLARTHKNIVHCRSECNTRMLTCHEFCYTNKMFSKIYSTVFKSLSEYWTNNIWIWDSLTMTKRNDFKENAFGGKSKVFYLQYITHFYHLMVKLCITKSHEL